MRCAPPGDFWQCVCRCRKTSSGPRTEPPSFKRLGSWIPTASQPLGLTVVKAADVARLDQASWQAERDKMLRTCNQCHSMDFASQQLQYGDDMIRNADRLMAEAIRTVAGLYQDGLVPKPKNYAYPFPDLLTFHDAPTRDRTETFRYVPRTSYANLPGDVPFQPGLRPLVRMERDAARPGGD